MAEPRHYSIGTEFSYPQPSQVNRTNRGKPLAHFLCKACLFALVIVLVPLFPSQAPEFISESLVTKFWELIHLLFVGIAVSYGLFCRRNNDSEISVGSNFDRLEHDMSRMFHVSSRSEEVMRDLSVSYNGSSFGERGVENGSIQAWNSQYFQGGSAVVVARPNCTFDESGLELGYKPLGLPVRSLKPRIRKRDKMEKSSDLTSGKESSLRSFGSMKSFDEYRVDNFADPGSRSSENRIDEALSCPSPIPWRSRSTRAESPVSHPGHFRLLSVDEAQFESLGAMRTPSLRSTVSFSSRASSASSSQGEDSSVHSVASLGSDPKVEDEEKETGFQGSYCRSSVSVSSPKPMDQEAKKDESFRGSLSPPRPLMDDKASNSASHSRGHSLGSFHNDKLRDPRDFLKEFQGSYSGSPISPLPPKPMDHEAKKDESFRGSPLPPRPLMDDKASGSSSHSRGHSLGSFHDDKLRYPRDSMSESRRDEASESKEPGKSSRRLDLKKFRFGKASSRGKSVRTVRPSRVNAKADDYEEEQRNKVADCVAEEEDILVNNVVDNSAKEDTEQSFNLSSPVRKPPEIQDFTADKDSVESEEYDEIIEAEEFRPSTSDKADSESVHGTRAPESDEVDKKASEFIAKFREQIRLQKVASMDRSRGLRFKANNFR